MKITRRLAVIGTSVALATGTAAVIATTSASASPSSSSGGGYFYCTPLRDGDPGMYCTPAGGDGHRPSGWLPWWFGNGDSQPPKTTPKTTTTPRPTTVAPPATTTMAPPQTTTPPRSSTTARPSSTSSAVAFSSPTVEPAVG